LSPDPALERYSRQYHRFLRRYESVSSTAELIKRVLSSDIVYHGDYHPLKQSQRSVLRIVREIAGKREIILCLEMFHGQDQHYLDQFMNNELSQKEFLKKIDYERKWGYKWENWKPIIDLCKQNGIPVVGINSRQEGHGNSLRQRDVFSAITIGKLILCRPGRLVYVVDGDYHISPNHLPAEIEKRLQVFAVTVARTIIYQNDANLYWQLAHEHKEDADVLQLGQDSFCILNTTPANKLQSYLNWLEFSEEGYHPAQVEWEDLCEDSGNTTIPGLVKTICKILELPYPHEAVERLEVYYGSHLDFMGHICHSRELSHMLPAVRRKIASNEGFLLEYDRDGADTYLIYLPTSSLNMAAEEAAHFLNAAMRGKLSLPLKPFDAFYRTVMTETLGFFGSKLINEKRKVLTRNALRRYLRSFRHPQKTPAGEDRNKIVLSHLLLKHRFLENLSHNPEEFKIKFRKVYNDRKGLHTTLATQLGYMLGDKLFYAVKKRRFSLKEVIELFKEPFTGPGKAFSTYSVISSAVKRKIRR